MNSGKVGDFVRPQRLWGTLVLSLFVVALCGCGKKATPVPPPNPEGALVINKWGIPVVEPGTSVLKGKVTCDNKPVKAGHIIYCYDRGISQTPGAIAPDGHYETKLLQPGSVTLCLVLDPDGKLPFPEQSVMMGGPPGIVASKGPGGGPPTGPPGPPGGKMGGPPGMPLPPGLPAHFVRLLRSFHVPKGEDTMYKQLHLKYCKTEGNGLKVVIGPDVTVFDITLSP